MNIEVDMGDVGVSLDVWGREVGETTEQVTIRYGVAVARQLAEFTAPVGKRKPSAEKLRRMASGAMRRVIEPLDSRHFNKLKRAKRPRAKIDGKWIEVKRGQFIEGDRNIWAIVEAHRIGGKTRDLKPEERYICKRPEFNRVRQRRTKLWGAAKGAWIGAGQQIAKQQEGMQRINIGKNFLGWTHRHANKGRAEKHGGGDNTSVYLVNKTRGGAKLSSTYIHRAMHYARKTLFRYYGAILKEKLSGRLGGTSSSTSGYRYRKMGGATPKYL